MPETLLIVCTDARHARNKRATIEKLVRTQRGWDLARYNRNVRIALAENTALHALDHSRPQSADSRDRYRFSCKLCKRTVVVRDDALETLLEQKRHAGAEVVELSELEAIQ
ncbi:hypothetical protein ACFPPE_18895 [Agromyces tardus]|uniref:hypothetical protein n=1 Tax=Agromyces tardus TaxID=2583849 RepID=UPI00110C5672|nr:hypothetical protein [Agromyces tardus]